MWVWGREGYKGGWARVDNSALGCMLTLRLHAGVSFSRASALPAIMPVIGPRETHEYRESNLGLSVYRCNLVFYGCSYRFHLSGDNSRDRYVKGS